MARPSDSRCGAGTAQARDLDQRPQRQPPAPRAPQHGRQARLRAERNGRGGEPLAMIQKQRNEGQVPPRFRSPGRETAAHRASMVFHVSLGSIAEEDPGTWTNRPWIDNSRMKATSLPIVSRHSCVLRMADARYSPYTTVAGSRVPASPDTGPRRRWRGRRCPGRRHTTFRCGRRSTRRCATGTGRRPDAAPASRRTR